MTYIVPSHSCDDMLLDMLRGEGSYFGERPKILSWSDLYRELVPLDKLRRQIDPPDHRLILRLLIDDTIRELDEQGRTVPKGARRPGFTDILSAALRELMLEDVSPDDVMSKDGPPDDKEITPDEILYRIYSDYKLYLDDNRLADSAQIPSLTRSDMEDKKIKDLLRGGELCFVGLLSLTGAQRKLAAKLRDLVGAIRTAFWVPDAAIEDLQDTAAQIFPKEIKKTRKNITFHGDAALVVASDVCEQYDAVAAEIAALRDGTSRLFKRWPALSERDADDIGIMVPKGQVLLMLSALRRAGIEYQVRCETAVCETILMEIAMAVWRAGCNGWPFEDTYSLLRSTVFGADDLSAERAFAEMPDGVSHWRKFVERSPKTNRAFDSCVRFYSELNAQEGRAAQELLAALIELADERWESLLASEAGDDGSLDAAIRSVALARSEARNKAAMLTEQARPLGPAGEVKMRGSDAAAFLTHWAQEATIALPLPVSGAVTVYDSPPPVLASHAVWIMTDVDTNAYPAAVTEQALLNSEIRSRVNSRDDEVRGPDASYLPTLHDQRVQKEALFRRLICVGEAGTILSRSKLDSAGKDISESVFLSSLLEEHGVKTKLDLNGKEIPDPEREPSGEDGAGGQQDARSREWHLYELVPMLPAQIVGPQAYRGAFPRKLTDMSMSKTEISVSAFETWHKCPYRFYLRDIAGIEPPQSEVGSNLRLVMGRIMHEIWEELAERCLRGGRVLPVRMTLYSNWDEIIKKIEDKLKQQDDASYLFFSSPRTQLAVASIKRDLLHMAEVQDDINRRAESKHVKLADVETEKKLDPLRVGPLTLKGRADRIDRWDEGAIIIDHKLGSASSYKDPLQLACYAQMLESSGVKVAGVCWFTHRDHKVTGYWRSRELYEIYTGGKNNMKQLDDAAALAMDELAKMGTSMQNGVFEARYADDDCRNCAYSIICRKGEHSGESFDDDEGSSDDE